MRAAVGGRAPTACPCLAMPTVPCWAPAANGTTCCARDVVATSTSRASRSLGIEAQQESGAEVAAATLNDLGLSPFVQINNKGQAYVYFEIIKTMCSLPNPGKLSRDRLTAHLQQYGYVESSTPGLFRGNLGFSNIYHNF